MLTVEVKLFATLRDYGPKDLGIGESFSVNLPKNADITSLLKRLKIPKNDAKIIMVNGNTISDHKFLLSSNDVIAIFPPVGGG